MLKILLSILFAAPIFAVNANEIRLPHPDEILLDHAARNGSENAAPTIKESGPVGIAAHVGENDDDAAFAKTLVTLYTRIHKIEDKIQEFELAILDLEIARDEYGLSRESERKLKTLTKTRSLYKTYETRARGDLKELLDILRSRVARG